MAWWMLEGLPMSDLPVNAFNYGAVATSKKKAGHGSKELERAKTQHTDARTAKASATATEDR